MSPDLFGYVKALAAVDQYGSDYRHPGRPPLIVHDAHTMSSTGIRGSWEGTEASCKSGCYLIFSADGDLLYVGKASNTKSLGSRLVRFRYNEHGWLPKPEWVVMVEVPEPFEAPSLEEFLISKLQPRFNDRGIRRS
jgi:hypothetical protein